MSEPLDTQRSIPDATGEFAQRMDRKTAAERLMRETIAARRKGSASRQAGQEEERWEPDTAPEALDIPEAATAQVSDDDRNIPSAEEDHARVMSMLSSAEWQKRLEEARAQREKVSASRLVELRPSGDDPGEGSHSAVAPGAILPVRSRNGPALPPSRSLLPSARIGPVVRPKGTVLSVSARPDRPPSWALSLVVGLVSGLMLGAGLMRFTGYPSLLQSGAADPMGEPAQVDSAAMEGNNGGLTLAAAGSATVGPERPKPIFTDPPHTAYFIAPLPTDHHPEWRRYDRLSEPQVADIVQVATMSASAPAGAGQWRPSPLPEPEHGRVIGLAAGNLSAFLSDRSARAPIEPPSSEQPPSLPTGLLVGEAPLGVVGAVQTSATTSEDLPPQVALHLSPDLSQAAISEAQSALRNAGFDLTSSSVASISLAKSQVFFFHQEDAPDAARMAKALGARVRDLSDYRPSPEQGRLEVWLGCCPSSQ